jgi:hypothetical protein
LLRVECSAWEVVVCQSAVPVRFLEQESVIFMPEAENEMKAVAQEVVVKKAEDALSLRG